MVENAEESTLRVLTKYAPNVPILIVRTMKDKVLAFEKEAARESASRSGTSLTEDRMCKIAEEKLVERAAKDIEELEAKGFSTDATPVTYVSRGMILPYHAYIKNS
jgi:hypothetical protein